MPQPVLLSALALAVACLTSACAGDDPRPDAGTNLDVAQFDRTADPCVDANAYVNRHWLQDTSIPPERASVSTLSIMADAGLAAQRELAQQAEARADQAEAASAWRRVGWFYRSGMDIQAIEAEGMAPLADALAQVEAIAGPGDLAAYVGRRAAAGQDEMFAMAVEPAQDAPQEQVLGLYPADLGLPTPADYTDPDSAALRAAYLDYIASLFALSGADAAEARARAATVLRVETGLAARAPSPEEAAQPRNQFRRVTLEQAMAEMPAFDWPRLLRTLGVADAGDLSIAPAPYFAGLDALLATTPIEDWRTWLRWRLLDRAARYLGSAWRQAASAFYDTTLQGIPEAPPRWRQVLDTINATMGQSLGELYVERHFDEAHRTAAQAIVEDVRAALLRRVERVDWMSEDTRATALRKIATMHLNIGYPTPWDDWSQAGIRPSGYYANVSAALAHGRMLALARLGQPVQRDRWDINPQTVNAQYDASRNAMTFTAAILQAPIFDPGADAALNFGGLGAVAGHEMTHAIDDHGSQYDETGRLVDWWKPADAARFAERGALLVQQAEAYVPLPAEPALRMNGRLTLGENIADLGGLAAASDALAAGVAQGRYPRGEVDGFLPQQRVFLAWVRNWRERVREPALRVRLQTDPHAPGAFRANNPPANLPAYAAAFACAPGQPMARPQAQRVQVW
ncbi:M13 family metallopeptidase [Verticiella sediminum]|uniref:M13 family metallopeptidase n=1 Tax=Verticiella sediminum TaxID=1247510 RepID=A0A556APM5_9BURK|nr:M13 family metallopeptidase [Verticiella sediminum]TSH94837.1 M13 family metallopeptidase [Verticiella sediminum]